MNLRIGMVFAALAVTPSAALAHSFGAPPGVSGAPGDSTCVACHGGSPNTGPGSVTISLEHGTTYTPGQTQLVTVTVSDPNQKRWGFEASPRLASDPQNQGAGTMAPIDGNTQLAGTSGTIQWITHTTAGTRNGTTKGVSFQFNWTAPASDVGDVTFYVAGNAANGNGAPTGDLIYTSSVRLTAASTVVPKPTITQNGVVNGASLRTGLVAGSWFSIFGANLAPDARNWQASDIVDGVLPTSLDKVSVTVNGKPAAICYISPTQINAQAPDDDSTGPVNVVVTTAAGASDPMPATLQTVAPALFLFSPQGNKYAAAVSADSVYLGPAGLFGSAVTTRPVRPGEIILLFGTGFGKTNPAVPAGTVFSGAASLPDTPQVTVGGLNATVDFAGLSAAGLYQFNITVPPGTPDGDQPLLIRYGGLQTQDGVYLSIQQ